MKAKFDMDIRWPFILTKSPNGSASLRYIKDGRSFFVAIYSEQELRDVDFIKECMLEDAAKFLREHRFD